MAGDALTSMEGMKVIFSKIGCMNKLKARMLPMKIKPFNRMQ